MAKILQQNKDADVKVMELDLANLASVKNFALNFQKNYLRLDLLINNAGVMIPLAKTTNANAKSISATPSIENAIAKITNVIAKSISATPSIKNAIAKSISATTVVTNAIALPEKPLNVA